MAGRAGRFSPGRVPEVGREGKSPRSYHKEQTADPESLWVCIRCRCALSAESRIGSGVNVTCDGCVVGLQELLRKILIRECRMARISVDEYHRQIESVRSGRSSKSSRVAQKIRARIVWHLRAELDVSWKLIARLVGYRAHAAAIEAFRAEQKRRHKLLLQ